MAEYLIKIMEIFMANIRAEVKKLEEKDWFTRIL